MIGAGAGASLANENDQDLYLNGSCHVFATALHRRYGMSLLVVGTAIIHTGSMTRIRTTQSRR